MLVPLYEAVYERFEVGTGTRLLGIGCGSGLALLLAAARGAVVTGIEAAAPELLALARERLLRQELGGAGASDGHGAGRGECARLFHGEPEAAAEPDLPAYNLITAFQPIGCAAGDAEGVAASLERAAPLGGPGTPVVLTGWGPPEHCAASSVLKVASRLADPLRDEESRRPELRDDLAAVAARAGLRPDGAGRVACPFGYADTASAVRGLLSTGLFDAAMRATEPEQVEKELTEALHPYVRGDGTVWMPNVFRYVIAHTR